MKKIASVCALSILALGAGCVAETGEAEQPLSWDEFQARATREPVTGTFIYDGDQTALDLADLREAYNRYRGSFDDGDGLGTTETPLIVNIANGAWDTWASPTEVTYCISQKSFGSRYTQVVAVVEGALQDWMDTGAGVVYTHVAAQDGNCTNRNNNVTFNVRQDRSTQYYAKAFFPSYPRSSREVVISTISYNPANLGPWTLRGILRHELGHTLGFRHEHIRPENLNRTSQCSTENTSWAPLTEYDNLSVMHYPHNGCAGGNTGDLTITALDAQGALVAYP